MSGIVHLVHCVDTEGPLYESVEATFKRIKESFGVELKATEANLVKLRNKEIELGGKEDAIHDFVRADMLRMNGDWDAIYKMHETLLSPEFRNQMPDSFGEGYVFNWFCLDHVGYEENPRRRELGFHAIHVRYQDLIRKYNCDRDRIYFHFHPMSFSREAHRVGMNYTFTNLHNEIIARRVIDHSWFPVAYRPTVAAYMDSNYWLEQWIPFDMANFAKEKNENLDKHIKFGRVPGRYADWTGSPDDWSIFQPSLYDERKPGNLHRYIGRCLNLNCRHSTIDDEELTRAFQKAEAGESVVVGVSNHDYRDMIFETQDFIEMVRRVSEKFPDVKFKWSNVVEAFRDALKLEPQEPPKLKCWFENNLLRVTSDKLLWGPQPFLAIKTRAGDYYHDNFILNTETNWTYPFDLDTLLIKDVAEIGVASNDKIGNTVLYNCKDIGKELWQ